MAQLESMVIYASSLGRQGAVAHINSIAFAMQRVDVDLMSRPHQAGGGVHDERFRPNRKSVNEECNFHVGTALRSRLQSCCQAEELNSS
jgi:hypothetical protein